MKYIVFQDPNEEEHIMLFPNYLDHAGVARAMEHFQQRVLKPISAGEAHIADACCPENYCHGKSTTLKLDTRSDKDTVLLNILLRH